MSVAAPAPSFFGVLLRRPSVWFGLIGSVVVLFGGALLTNLRAQSEALPVLSTVPAFEFTNHHGQPFGTSMLEGQVWVANVIFTRCPTICPTFTAKMATIQQRAPSGVELVSFTVDPEYDTAERLDAYAKRFGAGPQWSFLTGERKALEKVIVEGMSQPMDAPVDPANLASLVHGSYFVLVDKHLKVRGFYKFNEPASVDQVLRDAATLMNE